MRKVNNFAAAGNEGLGPAEDFQIDWRQVYAVGVICPPKVLNILLKYLTLSFEIYLEMSKIGGDKSHCPHMFRRAWGIGSEAK